MPSNNPLDKAIERKLDLSPLEETAIVSGGRSSAEDIIGKQILKKKELGDRILKHVVGP